MTYEDLCRPSSLSHWERIVRCMHAACMHAPEQLLSSYRRCCDARLQCRVMVRKRCGHSTFIRGSGSLKETGRSNVGLNTLKITVFAATPRPGVSTTMRVNAGFFVKERTL